ncbi:MAG: hypothetical protein JSV24_00360 [Bacteroidales bacterium]|nr:MAG: hypothetical protein JSV24_00360 [Bacteroidales bacterium]
MRKPNSVYWKICCLAAILLSVITFTPLVIPAGKYVPQLFGMPYSLWIGILITVGFVILTFLGTIVHPGKKEEEHK